MKFPCLENEINFQFFLGEMLILSTQLSEEQFQRMKLSLTIGRTIRNDPEKIETRLDSLRKMKQVINLYDTQFQVLEEEDENVQDTNTISPSSDDSGSN